LRLSLRPAPRPPVSALSPSTTLFRSTVPGSLERRRHAPWLFPSQPHEARFAASCRRRFTSVCDGAYTHASSRPKARQYAAVSPRSEEHTSELQSRENLVCRLLLEKKK